MLRRWLLHGSLLVLWPPTPAIAQVAENTPQLCQNGADDDGDGLTDCDDDSCARLIFCVGRARDEPEEDGEEECHNGLDDDQDGAVDCDDDGCERACRLSLTLGQAQGRGIYRPREPDAPSPGLEFAEHESDARYPTAWARHPLTLREGMLVPRLGVEVFNQGGADAIVRLGLGASYGIFDLWQIDLVAVPLRLAPTVEYASPALSTTLRVFAIPELELGLGLNLTIPVDSPRLALREPLPFANTLSRSSFGDVTTLDAALRSRIHAGDLIRIDLTPLVTIYFTDDLSGELAPVVDVSLTADAGVSITDFVFVGVTGGVVLPGEGYDPIVPLSFFVGGVIPGWRRGPAMDLTARFTFPRLFDAALTEPVNAESWQVDLDVRVFTFLLS